jgi:hypothetical protein
MTGCALTDYGKQKANELAEFLERSGSVGPGLYRDDGLEKLDSGAGRWVFSPTEPDGGPMFYDGDCVLKISTYGYKSQTENEIVTWQQAPPSVRELLVPVTDHHPNGHWLVMPKVQPADMTTAEDEFLDRLQEVDWTCEDIHAPNIGILDGEHVLLDYGYKCYPEGSRGEAIYDERKDRFVEWREYDG